MNGFSKPGKRVKRLIVVAIFIGFSNLQPLKAIFDQFIEPIFQSLTYATPSGGFSDLEMASKHRTFESVQRRFANYKQEYPTDSIVYRLYRINPLFFWEWREMISAPKYRLPYLDPESVGLKK